MAQGVASEFSSPAAPFENNEVLLQAQKVLCDRIADNINRALVAADPDFTLPRYSEAASQVLRGAWTVAAQLKHRLVTIDHVLVALITGADEEPANLIGGSDPVAPLTGALVRIAGLEAGAEQPAIETLMPADHVVQWLREACRLAVSRGGSEVLPMDLARVLYNTECDRSVRSNLRNALFLARANGRLRTQLDRARKGIESANQTAGRHRTETERAFRGVTDTLEALGARVTHLASAVDGASLPRLADQITEISLRTTQARDTQLAGLTGAVNEMRGKLTEVDRRLGEIKPVQLAGLVGAVDGCRDQIAALDRRTAEISAVIRAAPLDQLSLLPDTVASLSRHTEHLRTGSEPAPPLRWLAMATAGVIVLGIVLGSLLGYVARPVVAEVGQIEGPARPSSAR